MCVMSATDADCSLPHLAISREVRTDGQEREAPWIRERKRKKMNMERATTKLQRRTTKLQRKQGREIRRARDDARITSRERKASARLRYIKYNYSDSKKRAQVETYDNMVHGGLRARAI